MVEPTRVDVHVRCWVKAGRREEYLAWLREATGFYESPGGIDVRLLEELRDDRRFILLVLYEDEAVYVRDQERWKRDPDMRARFERLDQLLVEPARIEVYRLRRA